MTEGNLSHEEVFSQVADDKIAGVAEVCYYLSNDEKFRQFVSYICQGKLMKAFPETTWGEVRKWKKENA